MIHEMGQLQVDLLRRVAELERQVDSLVKPEVPRWVDWTPTVTQSGAVTVTVDYARYATYGGIAIVQILVTVTGSGTAGNGIVVGGQPAAIQPANTDNDAVIGTGIVFNAGTARYHGALIASAATAWVFMQDGNLSFIGAAPSFALVADDQISFAAAFERA